MVVIVLVFSLLVPILISCYCILLALCSDGQHNNDVGQRTLTPLPNNFYDFINQKVIPLFKDQRMIGQYQFAVVILLSERDFANINHMTFTPTDYSGNPIVNKDYPSMPRDIGSYGNYITGRPCSNHYHSEEVIFGRYSSIDSPFRLLWNGYIERNRTFPKCILLYTWVLPCSRCTDVIIRTLTDSPYNSTSVIVAHTTYWRSEDQIQHEFNRNKLISNKITVKRVKHPVRLSPGSDRNYFPCRFV